MSPISDINRGTHSLIGTPVLSPGEVPGHCSGLLKPLAHGNQLKTWAVSQQLADEHIVSKNSGSCNDHVSTLSLTHCLLKSWATCSMLGGGLPCFQSASL